VLFLSDALAASNRYDRQFRKYSKRFFGVGFDWKLFKAQAMAESGLEPSAKSSVGALGIMQLMPSTFDEIKSKNPELTDVNDPEWNIAAGIYYDRVLWRLWAEPPSLPDRLGFVFGSYNAGRGTILRAKETARSQNLDHTLWPSIESIAPTVPRWQHRQTIEYVRKIESTYSDLSQVEGGFGRLPGK